MMSRNTSFGSPTISPRIAGDAIIGAVAATISCSPSVIRPKPIATRPMRPAVLFSFEMNSTTPLKISSGESHDRSNENTTVIRLVPTSAPSITARPAAMPTSPLPTKDEMITAVAVLDCTRQVTASPAAIDVKRLLRLLASTRRRFSPKIRITPVRTMFLPQTSNAIAASKFSKWIIGSGRPFGFGCGGRSDPWQRVGLGVREALHRLLHAFFVPQAGVLDAAEGRQLEPVAGHLAHVDAADLQFGDEAGNVIEPVRADGRRQTVGRAVADADRLVDVRERDDRRDGAEGLLAHDRHLGAPA